MHFLLGVFQVADGSGIPKKIRRFSGRNSLRNIVLGPNDKNWEIQLLHR